MVGRYANKTTVSTAKSRAQIEETLQRFGADSFGYMTEKRIGLDVAAIAFRIENRNVRLFLELPSRDDTRFQRTPGRNLQRTEEQAYAAWEQECRRMWRSLTEVIKAKLIAVEDGISTVEKEFMADIMMPDGKTIAEHISPKIEEAYTSGKNIPLLPAPKG